METAWEAVRLAQLPRVHVFLATSPIHMQYKLKLTPDQVMPASIVPPPRFLYICPAALDVHRVLIRANARDLCHFSLQKRAVY